MNLAAAKVASGFEDLVVGGGVESMSRWTMGSDGGAWAMDPRVNDKLGFMPQGIGADLIATMEGFSRTDVDAFALDSHKRAAAARAAGHFKRAVVPVTDIAGLPLLDRDETIRDNASLEAMAKLEASFITIGQMGFDATALRKYTTVEKINHVHHAGNSQRHRRRRRADADRQPRGRQEGGPQSPRAHPRRGGDRLASPPSCSPAPRRRAARRWPRRAWTPRTSTSSRSTRRSPWCRCKTARNLGVELDRVNVNGGAIAMGHPLGATGCIILGTLLDELERRNLSTGLATLCVGGGMGIATIIERV